MISRLFARYHAVLIRIPRVPGRSQRNRCGHGGCGLLRAHITRPGAGWAVGHHERRNAQPWNWRYIASMLGVLDAVQFFDLLF